MTVELTIVGIRYYLREDEKSFEGGVKNATEEQVRESLQRLFDHVPVGSTVDLYKEPEGTPFPGSISVFDENGDRRGSVSAKEIHLVERAIPLDMTLTGTVTGHSLEDKCMYVSVENTVGEAEPLSSQLPKEEGETLYDLPSPDQDLLHQTAMMKSNLQKLEAGLTSSTMPLMNVAKKYIPLCCISLDVDSRRERTKIWKGLKELCGQYPELEEVRREIYELDKDSCKVEVMAEVYRNQYARFKDGATRLDPSGHTPFGDYINMMALRLVSQLSQGDLNKESQRLTALLPNAVVDSFLKKDADPESFAQALYYQNYTMEGLRCLYSRVILIDLLRESKMDFGRLIVGGNAGKDSPTMEVVIAGVEPTKTEEETEGVANYSYLSREEKKILDELLEYVKRGDWVMPATKENVSTWIMTMYGVYPSRLSPADAEMSERFRKFFRAGRTGAEKNRAMVSMANIVGYLKTQDLIKGGQKTLSNTLFDTDEMVNNINHGMNRDGSKKFNDLIPWMERYLVIILK